MLEFRNVVFQYDSEDFNIIDGLSFHLEKGEFVSVIGPSGCGKSTIFRLTNQLLPRRSGEILVDGKSIDGRRGPAVSVAHGERKPASADGDSRRLFPRGDGQACGGNA